jgi:hypothetical protein
MKLLPFERRWLLAIVDTILPPGDRTGAPPPPADLPMHRFADAFFRRTPAEAALGLRAAVWAVSLAPLAWRLKLRSFERLSRDEREELLLAFQGSGIYLVREIPTLLKMISCMGWAGFPEVQEGLGMPTHDLRAAPWTGRVDADPDDGVST